VVQRCRDKRAATKFFRGLFKGFLDVPHVIVIDKRQRYATQRELLPGVAPHWHDFNNYTENLHQPIRQQQYGRQGLIEVSTAKETISEEMLEWGA
jgi:transposase-like protein